MKQAIQREYQQLRQGPRELGWGSWSKALCWLLLLVLVAFMVPTLLILAAGKLYQHADRDPDRGAIGYALTGFGDGHDIPEYLDQGWERAESLWFYNVTQGTNIIPWDFFLELEQENSSATQIRYFRSNANLDSFRYLLQKPTLFNPEGLPVGFVKDTYKRREYLGFNCATCHTGQIVYRKQALRIDGGPAMADLDGFLWAMQGAMEATLEDTAKLQRFSDAVLARNDWKRALWGGRDYLSDTDVIDDLKLWTERLRQYNRINKSQLNYGYARLDAFGRIYNRVLQHVLNKQQAAEALRLLSDQQGRSLLTEQHIKSVLDGLNETVLGRQGFELMLGRLRQSEPTYPGLSEQQIDTLFTILFNEANAPVSYPYLWDVAHTDYVQWNGLQANAGVGALGRNTGQVIGVFASLDWQEDHSWFRNWNLAAKISGQSAKRHKIDFDSSVNGVNLSRMEGHLKNLLSPEWPEHLLGVIDQELAARGKVHYLKYCASCHETIQRDDWNRKITSKLLRLDKLGTDPTMANNATQYAGRAGNIGQTYQGTDVGQVIVGNTAPVRQILSSVTAGVIGTADRDKGIVRRIADQAYMLGASFFKNDLQPSIKSGDYEPDTTADPYASLRAYKARPLNGIWATAPYLHNGSVPTLYDLLLPVEARPVDDDPCKGDATHHEYKHERNTRPERFWVGSREFDPVKVGFVSDGYPQESGSLFDTRLVGNSNRGHEYAAGRSTPLHSDTPLPQLCAKQRWELLEFLKTL